MLTAVLVTLLVILAFSIWSHGRVAKKIDSGDLVLIDLSGSVLKVIDSARDILHESRNLLQAIKGRSMIADLQQDKAAKTAEEITTVVEGKLIPLADKLASSPLVPGDPTTHGATHE